MRINFEEIFSGSGTLDTLLFSKKLKEVKFTEEQAEFISETLRAVQEVSKKERSEDKEIIENKLSKFSAEPATRSDLAATRSDLKAEIEMTKADLKAEIVKGKIEIIKWVVGMILAQTGIIFGIVLALMKFIH